MGLLFWVPTGILEGGGSFSIQITYSSAAGATPVAISVPLSATTPNPVIGPATSVVAQLPLPTPPGAGFSITPYRIVAGS